MGTEPPLDAIARRADVGIGTLYRHFADRDVLLNAVAEHALERAADAAEIALEIASDGFDALRRYAHRAVDGGVGVLNIVRPLLDNPNWGAQREQMSALLAAIVQQAKESGRLRHDVHAADIVFATIRFSRPVDVGLSRPEERAVAHRQLDIYIDGLGLDQDRLPLLNPSAMTRFAP